MNNRLLELREHLQVSIWFIPLVLCLASLLLALVLLFLERDSGLLRTGLQPFAMPVSSARQVLGVIAGSVLSVGGVVFSVSMVALTLTSGQYGPKVMRQFLSDNSSKISLGMFLGTSIFCLVTISAYRESDQPSLTVIAAILLTIFALAGFIRFIHSIATDIQADQIIQRIGGELRDLLAQLVGGDSRKGRNNDLLGWRRAARGERPAAIGSATEGYIQTIDYAKLVQWSARQDCLVKMQVRAGDFVLKGSCLMKVYGGDRETVAGQLETLRSCVLTGPMRTPVQDLEYPITQLNQLAARALSPGINDPGTAITCVDWFSMALQQIIDRDLPGKVFVDDRQRPRVLARLTDFQGILKAFYAPAGQFSRDNIPVLVALLESLIRLAELTARPDRLAELARQGQVLREQAERGKHLELDLRDFRQRYRKLVRLSGRLATNT